MPDEQPTASVNPTPSAAATASAPKPAAALVKPLDLAPEGTDCPHCGQRMRVYARYAKSIEFCCPSLKEDPPVLADKYAEWRDLLLKSRQSRPL